jgi:HEAT repeats
LGQAFSGFERSVLLVTLSNSQPAFGRPGVFLFREIGLRMQRAPRKPFILGALLITAAAGSTLRAQQPAEVSVGGKSRAFWIASLSSENKKIRCQSCEALELMGPRANDAVPNLIVAAGDVDEQVRSSAMMALGEIGPAAESAVPMLIRRVHESQSDVEIRDARQALVGTGRSAAIHPAAWHFSHFPKSTPKDSNAFRPSFMRSRVIWTIPALARHTLWRSSVRLPERAFRP